MHTARCQQDLPDSDAQAQEVAAHDDEERGRRHQVDQLDAEATHNASHDRQVIRMRATMQCLSHGLLVAHVQVVRIQLQVA